MLIYQKKVQLETDFSPMSIRSLLNHWLIPRKMQHFLRINRELLVNGRYQSFNTLVGPGDQLVLNFSNVSVKQPQYLLDEHQAFKVRYENDDLLVVDKPAGIKTHPNRPDETGTLMNQVAAYLAKQSKQAYMVHRMDQQTSGTLLIAKTPIVVGILNRQLSQKTMARQYIAVVQDSSQQLPPKDTINFPIGQDPIDQRRRKVDYVNGLSAITRYQLLLRHEQTATLAVTLETGRTHQIRVHLAAINHPILGDPLYNANDTQTPRLLLHGQRLSFVLPFTDQPISVTADLPAAFQTYVTEPTN